MREAYCPFSHSQAVWSREGVDLPGQLAHSLERGTGATVCAEQRNSKSNNMIKDTPNTRHDQPALARTKAPITLTTAAGRLTDAAQVEQAEADP